MNKIYLITYDKVTNIKLREELIEIFGADVNIVGLCSYECEKIDFQDGIILITSPFVEKVVADKIASGCNYIVAGRVVNYKYLDKLIMLNDLNEIPICDYYDISKSVIKQLKEVGLNELNFVPYNHDTMRNKKYNTVITLGDNRFLPEKVNNVIDIGNRMIDIPTLVEVLKRLNIVKERENIILYSFLNKQIDVLKKYKEQINNNKELSSLYRAIFNNTSDGMIYTDTTGKILVANNIFYKTFKQNSENIIDKKINDVFQEIKNWNSNQIAKEIFSFKDIDIVLTKTPVNRDENLIGYIYVFENVSKIEKTEHRIISRKRKLEHNSKYNFNDIIHTSLVMNKTIDLAKNFALSEDTILIQGNSGTGKELFAQAIHNYSQRKNGPFVPVNFAALTGSLLESELFGYEEGSFTGAIKGGKKGLFEKAHGGTILLDEIGDAPVEFQARLLRVLQEQQIRRVGSIEIIPIDVRVIASTNINLHEKVRQGYFREDLYYRLNVLPIFIPCLKERRDDIPLLIEYYLKERCHYEKFDLYECITKEALNVLLEYGWPGNVRELINAIKYVSNVNQNNLPITINDLPLGIYKKNNEDEKWIAKLSNRQVWIMSKIFENNSAGRRLLASLAIKDKMNISEGVIRKELEVLGRRGYIKINKGVKGSGLTEKGYKVISEIDI